MSRCKFCGAEIDWIRTPQGNFVPVEPEPVFTVEREGTDSFFDEETGEFTGRLAEPWEVGLRVGWMPHARICQYLQEKGR